MTTERAEKLDRLMQNVFDAIEEYQETLKKSRYPQRGIWKVRMQKIMEI